MSMVKIGVQGGKGSFSESAGKTFARNHGIENFEIIYQISSEMVLGVVESGSIEFGVFAMENEQGGVVIESLEALALHRCKIVEMFHHIPISQNLLALQEVFVGELMEILSDQQALRQWLNYLSEYFWTRPLIEADDTAEAARRLSEGKLPKTAGVISNKNCAGIYDLKIIEEDIHDLKNNLTFFLGIEAL
jgi:prephenate dehydratase